MGHRLASIVVALLIVSGALATGLAIGRSSTIAPDTPSPGGAGSPVPATIGESASAVPEGWTTFRDDSHGFVLSYPAAWQRLDSGQADVPLVATAGDGASLLVRVIDLGQPVASADLPDYRRLTDDLVTAAPGTELLAEPRRIELAGVPGYYYFYAFRDEGSPTRGAHAHYFLFHGSDLVTLVFQTLPLTRFEDAAPTFDAIAASLAFP
jgi:hypothetical protein